MKAEMVWNYVFWAIAFGILSGVSSQRLCGPFEEGSSQSLTCSTKASKFSKFGPRIQINGKFEEMGYCDSNGECRSDVSSRFHASLSHNRISSTSNVTLHIEQVSRNMTRMRCFMEGRPLFRDECKIATYVKPSKPICIGPEFVEGGTAAVLTCTSDRVDSYTECGMKLMAGNENFDQDHLLSVSHTFNKSNQLYHGDYQLTCRFRVNLIGIQENKYRIVVGFHPPGLKTSVLSLADSVSPLDLKATTLLNPGDNNRHEAFDLETGQLELNIPIVSNPPPNRFSMSVRYSETSGSSVPVHSQHYTLTYRTNADDNLRGAIELTLAKSGLMNGRRVGFFTFTAHNGVLGSKSFKYLFTAVRQDLQPTQPTCNAPEIVDRGTKVLITCTSDRFHSLATCDFKLLNDKISLNQKPEIEAINEDSIKYPGDKKVTCRLLVSVVGSQAGRYPFQVEITPRTQFGNVSTSATAPMLDLKPTTLYDALDNNHVFSYPVSGQLEIDVHVIGNPEPKRVTLWVRRSEAINQVPVSSRAFQWTYERTVGSKAGVIQLSVTGGLESGGISTYILRVENGVVGEHKFEYNFTVNDLQVAPSMYDHSSDKTLTIVVGAAFCGLVITTLLIVFVVKIRRALVCSRRNACYDNGYIYPNMELVYEAGGLPFFVPLRDGSKSIYPEPVYTEPFC